MVAQWSILGYLAFMVSFHWTKLLLMGFFF